MGQLLSAIAEIMLFAVVILAFAVARVMHFIGIGEHPNLAAIAGAAAGIITVFIAPTASVAAIIVTIVVTIASNFLFGKLSDKLDDKFGGKLDAKIEASNAKADNREYEKVLNAADSQERIKYLKRHARYKKAYYYTTGVPAEQIFRAALQRIDSQGIIASYPDITLTKSESPEKYIIQFTLAKSAISLALFQTEGKTDARLGVVRYNDDGLKLKECMQHEDRLVAVLDRYYLLFSALMRELDPAAAATFH
ncbi:MAG: hypothetical protein LBK23_02425 [Oscillospiraceae bacterium]|jgi:hypothetical protein|nr:hypothetical protein [Oscillospiraceae bacterium]